jgi:hypothetical protein
VVAGGRFRRPAQQHRRPPVAADAHRFRDSLVQHRSEQAAGEREARAAGDQQPGAQGAVGQPAGLLRVDPTEAGDQVQVEAASDHRRDPQQLLDVWADLADPQQDGCLQRLGNRRCFPLAASVAEQPQRLQYECGVSTGRLEHLGGPICHAHPGGQLGHLVSRQRAELDPAAEPGQRLQRLGAALAGDRDHHQQPSGGQPSREEMHSLQGRGAGMLQVLQHQQQRLPGRQTLQQRGDRLQRAMVLQLGSGTLVVDRAEQPAEPGHELDQGAVPALSELAHQLRAQPCGARPDSLQDRLQEQRAFGLVAVGPSDHPPSRLRQTDQLPHKPTLAAPCGTGHQYQAGLAGGGLRPGRPQGAEFPAPANQLVAARPARISESFLGG